MPNHLAAESSPYLLQHQHNPVDWHAWGPAAFERAQAERWVAHHQRSLKRLLDAYEAGAICLEELQPRAERLREQIRKAEQAVKQAEDRLSQNAVLSAVITRLQDFAERVGQGLEQLDWQGRRQLIRTLVARVELDEEQATVVYRLPTSGGGTGGAALQTELFVDRRDVALHRADAQDELPRNLLVRLARGDQPQYLGLTRSQTVRLHDGW